MKTLLLSLLIVGCDQKPIVLGPPPNSCENVTLSKNERYVAIQWFPGSYAITTEYTPCGGPHLHVVIERSETGVIRCVNIQEID